VERACVAAGIPGSVIRAGDFFGAGTGSWLDQLIVKSLPAGHPRIRTVRRNLENLP